MTKDNVIQLAPHRRRKQEDRVLNSLGLTAADRAEAAVFISSAEMDQFVFRSNISETRFGDEDTFPVHPWTGD